VPAVDPAEVEGLKSALAVQQQQMAAQQEALDAQQQAVEDLQTELAQTKLDMIPEQGIKLDWEGHFRVRGHVLNHLYGSQTAPNGDYLGDARYMNSQLWLRPVFNFEDLAKLKIEFRAMDGVVWGDNMSNSSTALFAELPSETTIGGQEQASVRVSRAWTEFSVPVGLLRVGRQPSDWGMGLLANSGDRNDHKFGTSKYASTNDRVLFGTRPIAIYEAATGKADSEAPLILGVAVDRLVEDPLIQYFGFKCESGHVEGEADYDPRCDSDGDGVTDRDHDFTEDRITDQRGTDWWADPQDDVWEMVYVLVYKGEGVNYFNGTGDLTLGTYIVHRKQQETESDVVVADLWLGSDVHGVIVDFEGIVIKGNTRGIALQGSVNSADPDADPLGKQANIFGYASQVGYHKPGWKLLFEHGYASGDDSAADANFTGRPLNPDHNVGLLLYEEVLAHVTRTNWTDAAGGLWSLGGVYNSRYIFPTAHLYPLDNWEFLAGFVTAWPDKPDGTNIQCNANDNINDCNTPSTLQATASTIGYEVDFGIHHTWHQHLEFVLEGGFAQTTDRINVEAVGLNPEGKFFTVQTGLTYRL
jgi:hypothetical protein